MVSGRQRVRIPSLAQIGKRPRKLAGVPGYGWLCLSAIALIGALYLAYRYLIIRLAVRHGVIDANNERRAFELLARYQNQGTDPGSQQAAIKQP